jgi:hypothetical protein
MPASLERERTELIGQGVFIKRSKRLDSLPDRMDIGGGTPPLDVILIGMINISGSNFRDSQIRGCRTMSMSSSLACPVFGDEPVVFDSGRCRAVWPEVAVAAPDCDDGLPARFVKPVGRNANLAVALHGCNPWFTGFVTGLSSRGNSVLQVESAYASRSKDAT